MLLSSLGLLLLLLPLCSFAPGFFFIRKLHWNPLETLCGSIGLSLILLYLAGWAIYCAGPRGNGMAVPHLAYAAVALACAAAAVLSARDIVRLLRIPAVKKALAGFGFLLLWAALLTTIIRNFSGALWFGDWLEHFQRSLFFLRHFPANVEIFPGYALPARPPMMNVLSAFFLGVAGDRFEVFQAVFVYLNLLLFLPCVLLMPALGRRARRRVWLLVLLFAASPLVMQNITYTWTKAAAAFYVVMALWFYLAGWRKGDAVRTTAAFVALAAGLVVHYSAGPYVAILTLHYLIGVLPRREHKWRELAWIAGLCGFLVGTWLVWSVAVYGTHVTLASNSSVTSSRQYAGSTAEKIASNLFDTVVPLVTRQPDLLSRFNAQRQAGMVRDWFFVFYQVNAIFAMGLVGGPLVLWFAWRALRRRRKFAAARPKARAKGHAGKLIVAPATREQIFWRILIAAGVVLGVAVVGERDPLGVGHLTLLSLQVAGLAMLAAVVPWRRTALTVAILLGCAADFSFGVMLQAHVESLDNSSKAAVFPSVEFVNGQIQTVPPGPDALSGSAWNNWFTKSRLALLERWFAALEKEHGSDAAFQATVPRFRAQIAQARAEDASRWQGWFAAHGGAVMLIGDHFAAWSAGLQILLALLFVGLAAGVYRRAT